MRATECKARKTYISSSSQSDHRRGDSRDNALGIICRARHDVF